MGDDITIGVTEIVNNIEVTAQPNDQIVDISVIDNADDVTLNITPTVIEINVNRGSSFAKWGTILGTLSDQTDLQAALNLKANLVGGKVPASELPSYVDDVVEVANYAALPATGETGKIYVTLDNNKIYRWSGSTYIEIAANSAIWGAITGTLSSQTDLQNALNAKFDNPTGNITQYIAGDGSLITFPVAGQSGTLVREVRNTTGSTLTKGTIVYINGATGNKPTVAKAIATGDSTSAQTFGMLQADLANNANGYVVCVGDIVGLDTSAITEGTQLYLSSTTAGAYTTTKQVAPAHLVYIGVVTRSHPTLGQIEVKIQNGYELDEIHDVLITSKANNDLLTYESSSSLWKNKSISTILGYTPSNDSNVVHITGSETITGLKKFTDFLSTDKAYNQKIISGGFLPDAGYGNIYQNDRQITFLQYNAAATAVTQFSFIYPDSNTTQFYYVPNASGTLALTSQLHNAVTIGTANGLSLSTQVLSLGLASGSANGALSSTDWTTFNNKQNAITNLIDGIVLAGYIPKSTSATSGLTTLGNSAIYDNSGKIGIGTTSPTQKLDVNGFIRADSGFKVGNNGQIVPNGYWGNLTYAGTGAGFDYGLVTSGGSGIAGVPTGTDNFYIANKLGIGTTSPSNLLTIRGNGNNMVSIQYNSDGGASGLGFFNSSGTELFSIGGGRYQMQDELAISRRGTSVIYINNSNNVGIGTTSPSAKLNVSGDIHIGDYGSASSRVLDFRTNNSLFTITTDGTSGGLGTTITYSWANGGQGPLKFNNASGEVMRLSSGGSVLVGTTTNTYVSRLVLDGAVDNNTLECKHTGTGSVYNVIFVNGNGYVGDIRTNGSSTSFNTTSDYRLKQDLQPINGLDLVSQIKVYNYQWKVDESRSYGVLAHELQEVIPQAVSGEKDAEQMQSVDYSKLVPILVQAIQELKAEIEILKTK
jgi:hypothetical protein